MRGWASPHSRHTRGRPPGPHTWRTPASRVVPHALSVRTIGRRGRSGVRRGWQTRTEIPHHPSNQEWINTALGIPFASSFGRPNRRISPRQGRKKDAEPINRFRVPIPIYTAMYTEHSPASQTRASNATCLRGLIDNTKDCTGKEPKERAGPSNNGEAHSTVYRTPNL